MVNTKYSILGNIIVLSHEEYIQLREYIKNDIEETHSAMMIKFFNEQSNELNRHFNNQGADMEMLKEEIKKLAIAHAKIQGQISCIGTCVDHCCSCVTSIPSSGCKCIIS